MGAGGSKTDRITRLDITAYKVPTETAESDGTLQWDSTTMVMVEVEAAGKTGLGYTYADVSAAHVIRSMLRDVVAGQDPMDTGKIFEEMHRVIRNNGNNGIAFMALSAVDVAVWDLKAKILGVPLAVLLGPTNKSIKVYGSGGFTTYNNVQLTSQLRGWTDSGITQVKMKIGTNPEKDVHRIRAARDAIGTENKLFVDANGAFSVKQALRMAHRFRELKVTWYEEPVSSDDLEGLAFVKSHCEGNPDIAAGEYGFDLPYFKNMLEHGAVDVLQADATRCGGITGFTRVGSLARAFGIPFSFHCAPSVHLHAALSVPGFYTGEYFYDHVRIEKLFFDGFREPEEGRLSADTDHPGLGLELKHADAEHYMIYKNQAT